MKKIKAIISSIFIVILTWLATFGSIFIFSLLFLVSSGIDSSGVSSYTIDMANFFKDYQLLIVGFSGIVILPFIYNYFRKNSIKISFRKDEHYSLWLLLGVFFSLICNILLFDFSLITEVAYSNITVLLSTGVLGPIIEECVFRGVIYNKLKKQYSFKASLIITSILFAVYHLNLIQGIYAFLFSILITYIYEKSSNLLGPIIVHCFGNLSVTLFLPFILRMPFLVIQIVLVVLILLFIFVFKKNVKLNPKN